jgi:hypothetical protein
MTPKIFLNFQEKLKFKNIYKQIPGRPPHSEDSERTKTSFRQTRCSTQKIASTI